MRQRAMPSTPSAALGCFRKYSSTAGALEGAPAGESSVTQGSVPPRERKRHASRDVGDRAVRRMRYRVRWVWNVAAVTRDSRGTARDARAKRWDARGAVVEPQCPGG